MDVVLSKLDFEKARVKVTWSSLQKVMRMKGFDPKLAVDGRGGTPRRPCSVIGVIFLRLLESVVDLVY